MGDCIKTNSIIKQTDELYITNLVFKFCLKNLRNPYGTLWLLVHHDL